MSSPARGNSFSPAVRPLYEQPLVLDEGEGVRVRDVDGREYLDLFSGILTTSVGHCHPRSSPSNTGGSSPSTLNILVLGDGCMTRSAPYR